MSAENIQARKDAEAVIALCADVPQPARFWDCLAALARERYSLQTTGQRVPPVPLDAIAVALPMSAEEAHAWEREETMPGGQYCGMRVWEVPAAYLEWWSDNNHFNRQLDRYLKSSHYLRKRMEE